MTASGDLYAVLGIAPSATPEQIRRAYRALARRHHPDTRSEHATSIVETVDDGRDEALRRVMDAYAVLGDGQARADYDRARRSPMRQPLEVRRTEPRPRASNHVQFLIRVGPVRWQRW